MKFVERYKWLLILCGSLLIIILVIAYFTFYNIKSVYGNRLEGINQVLIKEDLKNDFKSNLLSLSEVDQVNIDIRGKIINIIIIIDDGINLEKAYQIADNLLTRFPNDILAFYDVQFFINLKNEVTDYTFPIIGYKNKNSHNIVWTLVKGDHDED